MELSGDFAIDGAPQRPGSRQGETHVPEIRIRRNEFDADECLALTVALDGNHAAFDRSVAVFVYQNQHLSHCNGLVELQERTVPVHRLRFGLDAKLIAILVLAVNGYGDGDADSQRPAAFFTSEVKDSHERH